MATINGITVMQSRCRYVNDTPKISAIIHKGDQRLGRWIKHVDKYILADDKVIYGIQDALDKYKEAMPKANENDLIYAIIKLNRIEIGIRRLMMRKWRYRQVVAYVENEIITLHGHESPLSQKEIADTYGKDFMVFDVPNDIVLQVDKYHKIPSILLKGKLCDNSVLLKKEEV